VPGEALAVQTARPGAYNTRLYAPTDPMSQYFHVHPVNPQPRLLAHAVEILQEGGVIVYPTDSCYALGCRLGEKASVDRIRALRRLDDKHNLTLVCRDLSAIASYAKIDNSAYRMLKTLTPGPYTFLLRATGEVPRRLQHPKRKSIGIRVPDHVIAQALLEAFGEPLISTTLRLPGEELPLVDPDEILDRVGHAVDLVINGGACGVEPTTVVDMTVEPPEVVRAGLGDTALLD
jgi:tRNA threonylcarbamoyl adenosine modification protein (Sua5/YciO/YrdC/YwlC family)